MAALTATALAAALCLTSAGARAQTTSPDAAKLEKLQNAFSDAAAKTDWSAAEKALAAIVEINRARYGTDNPGTLSPLETRATVVQLAGDYALSEKLYREALAARARIGAPEGEQIALDNNGLAQAIDAQGRYADAEPFFRKALAIRKAGAAADPASRSLSLSYNNLATNLANGGKFDEAEALYREALKISLAREGPEGPTVPNARLNLAGSLTALGRYAEAEAEQRLVMASQSKRFGPQSAEVARSLNALGMSLANQGRYAEAQPLIRQAMAIRKATVGEASEGYLEGLNNLASVLQAQGKLAEAEPMYRQGLATARALVGPDHPYALLAESNLANDLSEQSKLDEAITLMRRVREVRVRVLGHDHPDTAVAITNLAETMARKGDILGAETLSREALAIMIKVYGDKHDRTATAYSNLAENLMSQGRFAEAEAIHRQALFIREDALGEKHPDTGISYTNLAGAIGAQRDYKRAQPLFEKALAVFSEAVPDSLQTAGALNNLAANLNELDRSDEAIDLYRKALAIRVKLLGENHPATANVINNIGYTFYLEGRKRDAVQWYQRAHDIYRRAYGENSQAGLEAANNLAFAMAEVGGSDDKALGLVRAQTAATAARRRAIVAGVAAGGDNAAQAALRARSDSLLDDDPSVTSFITLTQVDWIVAGRDPARGEPLKAEAFRAAQQISVSRAGQAMARTAARVAAGQGPLGDLVTRQQQLAERIAALESELSAAQANGDRALADAANAESAARAKDLAAVDAQIDAQFPDYARLIAPGELDVAEVQRRLAPDEGLLFIQPSNGDLFSFAVSKTGLAWHRAARRQMPAKADVEKLLCQADERSCTVEAQNALPAASAMQAAGNPAYDRQTAYALYRDLVAPVESALGGVKRLYVTTPGALGRLPFEMLVTAAPAGGDDADPAVLAKTPWLGERYALTVLPSISTLRALAASRGGKAADVPFRGYGAPKLDGRDGATRGAILGAQGVFRSADSGDGSAMADPTVLRRLPPLAGTRVELAAMAQVLGAPRGAIQEGAGATEAILRSDPDLRRARVVALATHGLLPNEIGGIVEPGLVLTPPTSASLADDGVLTASEASALHLVADWVILSACNTASADSSADSLSSLSRAFLLAGARSLLASHWRVNDEATAVLTVETLRADAQDTRAVSLQKAMAAVRGGKRLDGGAIPGWKPIWAHPMFWAPFSLISTADD